jgi:D-glycero-alpha-D-manno-heptose-7-phosphate kinase
MIITRTPLRISLGGGGTDIYNWYSKNSSFFISAAIDKYIYVSVNERSLEKDYWISYSKIENVKQKELINHSIISQILKNKKLKKGIEIHTISEVPSGSGLGSSGALAVGLIKSIMEYEKKKQNKKEIAISAVKIEKLLNKKNSGMQDQLISAFGGIKYFNIDKKGHVKINKLNISSSNLRLLNKNILLVYTNEKREAIKIIKKQNLVINKFKNKNYLMHEIQKIGYESFDVLNSKNISQYGELLDRHWNLKKKFGDFMTSKEIDKLYEKFKANGANGGKIIGAGGGGFFMLYAQNPEILKKYLLKNNFKVLNWKFDFEGSKIILNSFNKS